MTGATPFDEFVEQLREVFFALRGISQELLADLDCTAAERSLLRGLDRGGAQTVPAMAQARAVSRQAMQKTIDRLMARRWLRPDRNPRHLRSPLIALTPAGRRVLGEIQTRERRALAAWELPIKPAALRSATETLKQLAAFLASDKHQARR